MLALLAAQEAADIASGHGSPLTAPIGTGTVDGFAAGMLLSGVVFLLILAQRRALRRPAASAAPVGRIDPEAVPAGSDHTGQALAQDSALGVYPAPVSAAPVEADLPALLADLPVPLADLPAPLSDLPAPLPELPTPLADLPAPFTDPFVAASFEVPEVGEQIGLALGTHSYADVSPFAGAGAPASFTPFADEANEVLLQPGVRLEEWLEGEMRRPSLPRRTPTAPPAAAPAALFEAAPAPAATTLPPAEPAATEPATTEPATTDPSNTLLAANVPAAVAAAEAPTAVVPVTPPAPAISSGNAADPDLADEAAHHRRSPAYQSKHRLVGRNDSKPWPDNNRRGARHAAASPTRPRPMSRMFGLRQLRPVSAGD